jgi:hypothetical protein
MISTKHVAVALLLSTGLGSVACGGSSKTVDSGVDPSKEADELSAEEIQDVCQATVDAAQAIADDDALICRLAGIFIGQLAGSIGGITVVKETCSSTEESCLEDPSDYRDQLEAMGGLTAGLVPNCEEAPESIEGCTVTVGEYESCASDQIDGIADAFGSIPDCDDLTEELLDGGFEGLVQIPEESPASCEAIADTDGCEELAI